MDFIYKKYRPVSNEHAGGIGLAPVYDVAHILDSGVNGTQRVERRIGRVGYDFGQCSLSDPGRPPQYKRGDIARFYHAAENSTGTDNM